MAQIPYKIDLHTATFPMLSEQQTRTIIGSTAGEAPRADEKPGIAYCHNVMPSNYGIDSIGYLDLIPAATLPSGLSFTDVRIAYGDAKSRIHIAWDTRGNTYVLLTGSFAWLALPATGFEGPSFSSERVTIGTVNGVSYFYYSQLGAFFYNEVTNTLDSEVLVGLTAGDILGLVASSGYLIAYTSEAIAWSSTITPVDFVPSQVTGAGGGNVAGIAGVILFITSNSLGMLIYTVANIIAGTYTGNARYPFKFREVDNSKGGTTLDSVAYEANTHEQYVYSKAGLQAITSQKADIILPEVTDFLAGKKFEDFNEATGLYEITILDSNTTMLKKIKFVGARYLVISYGITSFTHAIVFDVALKQMGKLRITHVDVIDYIGAQIEVSKQNLSVVLATGEVKAINFSTSAPSSGVVILGKLQYVRNRRLNLLEVEVENIPSGATLAVSNQVSLRGKGYTSVAGYLKDSIDNLRSYNFRSEGENHSLVFIGQFNLTTVQVAVSIAGRR